MIGIQTRFDPIIQPSEGYDHAPLEHISGHEWYPKSIEAWTENDRLLPRTRLFPRREHHEDGMLEYGLRVSKNFIRGNRAFFAPNINLITVCTVGPPFQMGCGTIGECDNCIAISVNRGVIRSSDAGITDI